jgi:hypothetical protein
MKNLIRDKTILLFILMFVATLYSCTDNSNVDPAVNNREEFLGTWTVDESCIRLNYEVEITADTSNNTKVLLYNFAFMGQEYDPAYGFVSGTKVTLPTQTVGDDWQLNGSGTLQSDGTIIWTYYVKIGANGSKCQADYQH